MKNSFTGLGVALVTPFNDDKSIDFEGLKKLVRLQLDGGTDFLVVQGTTGESPTLSWEEKLKVLETVQIENNGKLKIVFGVGGNNTLVVGEILENLPRGIDGILSVSPYYNKPTQKGIIAHFKHIASCTELPIILYNVPARTGSNMLPETTLELAKIKNVVAMKEASGNMEQIMELVRLKPEGFDVLSGDDALTLPLISIGVSGVISVVANAFPEKFSKMVRASMKDDMKVARKEHFDLFTVTKMLFEEGNPAGVKIVLEERGIIKSAVRLPLFQVSEDLKIRIIAETKRLLNA